jgi:hypothetical protein
VNWTSFVRMEILFALAIIAAIVAVAARRRRAIERPSSTRAEPIRVAGFREMDAAVDLARCDCGGRWRRLGETPGPRGSALRGVRLACTACEDEGVMWFSVSD